MPSVKLKFKISFIALILFGLFSIYFLFVINFLINQEYEKLEKDQLIQRFNNLSLLLNMDIDNFSTTARDYAIWDDAHQFIKDRNSEFIESNFTAFSLSSLKINLIYIYSFNNQVAYSLYYDYYNSKEKNFPKEILNYLNTATEQIKNSGRYQSRAGLVKLSDGVMFLAASSIGDSLKSEPISGALFFGRNIDSHLTEEYSRLVGYKVELTPFDSEDLDIEYMAAKNSLQESNNYFIKNKGRLYLYGLMYDLNNEPALIVKIESSSDFISKSQNIFNWLVFNLFIINLLFVSSLIVVIYILTINRINNCAGQIEKMDLTKGQLSDINLMTDDEITFLVKKINSLINRFRFRQDRQKKIVNDLMYENAELESINEKLISRLMEGGLLEKEKPLQNKINKKV